MRAALASLLAFVLMPGLAVAAQDQATGSLSTIPLGTTVQVIITNGQELTGPVVGASAESLVLDMPLARRVVPAGEIVRVEKRDSLKNGTIIGAAVGLGLMVFPTAIGCGQDPGTNRTSCGLPPLLFGAGIGALVGVGVDALIGNEVLYTASSSRQIRIAPWAAPSGAGVRGVINWR